MKLVVVAVLATACNNSTPPTPSPPAPAHVAAAGSGARQDIDVPGDANGLYWDAGDHTLYFTDATHDSLAAWTDAKGFAEVAQLPQAPKIELGGLTRLADGTFIITSFGFGTDGTVFAVSPSHQATSIPNLDNARRRIGVARAPDGAIYVAYFVVDGHQHTGGVAKLDVATGETDVVTKGLSKAVGVAATATGIYVSDQETNTIYTVQAGDVKPFATGLPSADLLAVLPDGSLVTGGKAGTVTRIAPDGMKTTIASGFEQVRGIAYDPAGKRLFVVEHSKATSSHKLHILPLAL